MVVDLRLLDRESIIFRDEYTILLLQWGANGAAIGSPGSQRAIDAQGYPLSLGRISDAEGSGENAVCGL